MKKIVAILAGAAIAGFAALPASAATVNGVGWSAGADYIDEVEDTYYDSYGLDGTYFNISLAGESSWSSWTCGTETETTEIDDDVRISCDEPQVDLIPGIDADGEVKIFAGDYAGLVARQVISLTNTTGTDIVIDYEYSIDLEECYYMASDAGTIGTPDGDLILEDGEIWYSCANDNDATESVAFGVNGFARGDMTADGGDITVEGTSTVDEGFGVTADENIISEVGPDEFYVWNQNVTVPAGETITFVYFYRSIGATDHGAIEPGAESDASILAFMDDTFGTIDGVTGNTRLWEDLDSAYNWEDNSASQNNLADTGADASGIALGGALALAAGVAVAIRRRARA